MVKSQKTMDRIERASLILSNMEATGVDKTEQRKTLSRAIWILIKEAKAKTEE